jgi:hypothetical protein
MTAQSSYHARPAARRASRSARPSLLFALCKTASLHFASRIATFTAV